MANSLTAFNPEYWANEMQPVFYKENVAIAIANTAYRSILSDGDVLNRPYRSALKSQTYSKGTDVTLQDVKSTNEQLSVDTAKIVPFYVDDLDRIQNKWDTVSVFAKDAMRRLNNELDRAVLSEYASAASYMDAGDVGGSAGSNITVAGTGTVNVNKVFARAKTKLGMLDVPFGGAFAVVGPHTLEELALYVSGRETTFGDTVGMNGLVGNRFGFEIRVSNNLPFTASLATATNPTANDTMTIAGVTFKFVATPSAAGDIDIGADAATTTDNIVAAINGSGTPGTSTYIDISDADRERLINAGIVATDNTTSIGIVGYGDIDTSETFTAVGNVWSAQTQHSLFGIKGATDLVVQKAPNVEFRQPEKKLGRTVLPWMFYGKKTFTMETRKLVDIKIDASGF